MKLNTVLKQIEGFYCELFKDSGVKKQRKETTNMI